MPPQRIFIGDVQGCSDELETLVSRARAAYGDDFVLWVAGDLVNRGPGNLSALRLVRSLCESGQAEFVLGNHEIFLIAAALGVREMRPNDSVGDVLGSDERDDWIDWLRERPLAVPGEIDGHPFVMLHASAHPEWPLETVLEKARSIEARLAASAESARSLLAEPIEPGTVRDDLDRLTRGRSVLPDGSWLSEEPASPSRAWHEAWSERGHAYGIVYGHWARQGLHLADGLRGLDTGCVHHGRGRDGFLTGWLPDAAPPAEPGRPFGLPDDRLWQIPARRRYYNPVNEDGVPESAAAGPSQASD